MLCCGSGLPNNRSAADSSVKNCRASMVLVKCLFSVSLMLSRSGCKFRATGVVFTGGGSTTTGLTSVAFAAVVCGCSDINTGSVSGSGSGLRASGSGIGSGSARDCWLKVVNWSSIAVINLSSGGICLAIGSSKNMACKASAQHRANQIPAFLPVLVCIGFCRGVCIAKSYQNTVKQVLSSYLFCSCDSLDGCLRNRGCR